MKRILGSLLLAVCCTAAFSQKLTQVNLAGGLSFFSFYSDPGVLIRVSPDGNIMDFGTELASDRGNFYAPKLQPYLGRIERYAPQSDSAFRGKIKSIGTSTITYYGSFEPDYKAGKLKSIGMLMFDYYTNFDNVAYRGKLRFIGSQVLEYYSSVEDEALRGKLKAIGNTSIQYYSSFEDRYLRGKIKSIGSVVIQYYSSQDRVEMRGQIKAGLYRPNVGGVIYILQ